MKGIRVNLVKSLTMLCVVALLATVLFVPLNLTASAESNIVTCDFEKSVLTSDATKNTEELNKNGVGIFGWAVGIGTYDGDKTLTFVHDRSGQNWATSGGYRLNDDGKMINLKPATSYVVTFKLKVVAAPMYISGSDSSPATISIGYGARFNSALPGNGTNYVNTLDNKISNVISIKKDAKNYTLYNNGVETTAEFSKEWKDVYYTFTTPDAAALSGKDMALTIFTTLYYGAEAYIDDVKLVEVANGDGVVLLKDEYSKNVDILIDKIGEAATLADISDRKNQDDHVFEGWYTDEALTVKAEEVLFADTLTVIYSKWDAPVTYTFKNTLDNTETKIDGKAGGKLTMPADLIDPSNEYWFMGWYHNADYVDVFTDATFGYASKTIYSKWLKEIPTLTQDFENYNKDEHKVVTEGGYQVKNNRLYFSMMMEKQSEVTYDGSGYAIKFPWNKAMTKTTDNPSSYVAASRYNQMDMYVWLGNGLDNGQEYVVTFKYKVEKADTDVNFYVASAMEHNIWANYSVSPQTAFISKDEAGKGWKEATLTFTTNYKNGTSKDMFLGVKLVKNEDVIIYFDNVEIKPKAQPYEASVNVEPNNEEEAFSVTGKRGEEIELPTISHPDGADFLGWYTDKDLTTEFTGGKFERNPITVYAKWGAVPVTFRNYADKFFAKPDNQGFGKEMSIDDSGMGIDDDYALRLNYRGDHVYKVTDDGTTIYMNTRYNQLDHLAQVAKGLTNGTAYRLSFWVKVNDANTDMRIRIFTGHSNNIWVAGDRTEYTASAIPVTKDTTEWKQVSTYFTGNINGNGNRLYLVWNMISSETDAYADVLIDNVMLEEVSPPYLMFDAQNGSDVIFLKGKVGEKINFPTPPTRFDGTFNGWYYDKACTKKFTETEFSKEIGATLYAGYSPKSTVLYTFEKYDLKPNALAPGKYHVEDAVLKKVGSNTVVQFDRTGKYNPGRSAIAVAHGTNIARVPKGGQCIVTFKYRLTKAVDESLTMTLITANADNMWAYTTTVSPKVVLSLSETVGMWKTEALTIDSSLISERNGVLDNALYVSVQGGKGGILQIDDVKVAMVPNGQSIVAVKNGGCEAIPSILIGKEGQSFKNKLPENPTVKGMRFVGYFKQDTAGKYVALTEDDYKYGKNAVTLYARFFPEKIVQNFDEIDFKNAADQYNGFTVFDFDYEHYDSEAEGNSKDNVVSGRYSLHRKGESRHVEASILLPLGKNISEASRYTVTMKIKLGKHLHTDGAVKIVSGRSFRYAWTTTGEFYPVVPIADLKEGEWVEVSYTFNSVEGFVTITTPGYVELFIDDVVFTLVDSDVPLSTPKEYTEYVTAERDANGNLMGIQVNPIDVDAIIDENLLNGSDGNNTLLIIIIAGGAVLIAAAAVLLIVIKKKKKKA